MPDHTQTRTTQGSNIFVPFVSEMMNCKYGSEKKNTLFGL